REEPGRAVRGHEARVAPHPPPHPIAQRAASLSHRPPADTETAAPQAAPRPDSPPSPRSAGSADSAPPSSDSSAAARSSPPAAAPLQTAAPAPSAQTDSAPALISPLLTIVLSYDSF